MTEETKKAPVLGIAACAAGAIGAAAGAYCNAAIMPEYHRASQAYLGGILSGRRDDAAAHDAWVAAKEAATPMGFVAFGLGGLALVLAIVGVVKKQKPHAFVGLGLAIIALIMGALIVPAM